jgi:hypothetical protein
LQLTVVSDVTLLCTHTEPHTHDEPMSEVLLRSSITGTVDTAHADSIESQLATPHDDDEMSPQPTHARPKLKPRTTSIFVASVVPNAVAIEMLDGGVYDSVTFADDTWSSTYTTIALSDPDPDGATKRSEP